jgi:hypothetical protein
MRKYFSKGIHIVGNMLHGTLKKDLNTLEMMKLQEQTSVRTLIQYIVAGNDKSFANLSDMEKLNYIRDWAIRNLPIAKSLSPVFELPAAQFLVKNLLRECGVWCGGSAHLLAELYRSFGFDAVSVDFGVAGTSAIHVMTAVKVPFNENFSIFLYDGYIGLEFIAADGNYADLLAMTKTLMTDRQDHGYTVRLAAIPGYKPHLAAPSDVVGANPPYYSMLSDGLLYADITYFQNHIFEQMIEAIASAGYPGDIKSYLLLPVNVHHTKNSILCDDLVRFYKETLNISLNLVMV